jgi:rifampicin phosphotransferase
MAVSKGAELADRWITDNLPSERFGVYTRSNAGEVLPDPASPLGWTLVWERGVLLGWGDGNVSGGSFDHAEMFGADGTSAPPVVGSFGGYMYINAAVVRVFGERSGAGAAAIDAAFFGNRPDTPPYVAHPDDLRPEATARVAEKTAWVLSAESWPELLDDKAKAAEIRAARPDLSTMSDADLVERASSFLGFIRHLFDQHTVSSSNTAIGPTVVASVVGAIDPTMVLRLVAGIGDVDSALPSYAMWDLSRLPADSDEYRSGFADFLYEFGSRGPNEWDIRADTWETKPALATALINRMRQLGDADSPRVKQAALVAGREAATAEALAALAAANAGDEAIGMFHAGQRSALLFLAARERTKSTIIRVIHEVRMATRELARRMASRGHLDHAGQLYMLTADEFATYLDDPDAQLSRLRDRETAYRKLFELEPPYFVTTQAGVPPLSDWAKRGDGHVEPAKPGDVLAGAPGCPGVATGIARVVLDPDDDIDIGPGDVLIAPLTDPAWTPLFVPAAAVVVDVGAMNSHAIIVSRELGIPCVVSATGATRRIPSGATVTVDGTTGSVTVVAVP